MRQLWLALCAISLAACATSQNTDEKPRGLTAFDGDPRLGEQVDKICFNRTIDGFSNATDRTVVLSAGVSKDYIVEVSGVCRNLAWAQSIGMESHLSCVSRGDYLIVSESAFGLKDATGLGPDRCLINRIHRWDAGAQDEKSE